MEVKITQVGNSKGIILPKDILEALNVEKGDTLWLSKTPEGYSLSPYDPKVAEQVRLGREFMKEYRETFKALAE
jgi:putative addiction module antidote